MELKKYKNLVELLSVTNAKTIVSLDEFREKIFDMFHVDDDNMPLIKCKKASLIVCDNKDFNETYVFDLVNAIFDKNEIKGIREIDYYYCDDFQTKLHLSIKSDIKRRETMCRHNNDENTIENQYLRPCAILVLPKINDMFIEQEYKMFIIQQNKLEKMLKNIE